MQKHFVTDYSICSNDLYLVYHLLFRLSFIRQGIVYLFNGSRFFFFIHPFCVGCHAFTAHTRKCNDVSVRHFQFIRFIFFHFIFLPKFRANSGPGAPPEHILPLPPTNFGHVICFVYGLDDDRNELVKIKKNAVFVFMRTHSYMHAYVCTCDTFAHNRGFKITITSK